MRYHTILFDLDGTLTNSYEGITKCVQYALSFFDSTITDRKQLSKFIGPSLFDSFTTFCNMPPEQATIAVEKYRERFQETGIFENELYPGVVQMLQALSDAGLTLAIASSKPLPFIKQILDYFEIARYFQFVGGAELDGSRTSKEDVMEFVLEQLVPADRTGCLMVGDTAFDANGAQHHGLDFCGVLYGFGENKLLQQAPHVYLAETTEDLQEFILHG